MATVLDAADALGWDRFHLIGHSMGAGIASLVAASCPERIATLVAMNSAYAMIVQHNYRVAQRLR